MKSINNFITEKLRIGKSIKYELTYMENILDTIFNDNQAYEQNREQIIKLIDDFFVKVNGNTAVDYENDYGFVVGKYDDFLNYMQKHHIDYTKYNINIADTSAYADDLLPKFKHSDLTKKYNDKNTGHYIHIYGNRIADGVLLDSGLQNNDTGEIMSIMIWPNYVLDDYDFE